jgi:hypothetical protein
MSDDIPENVNGDHGVRASRTKQMQLRELVDRLQQIHERAAKLYTEALAYTPAEEARMMLTHLAEHERTAVRKLGEYKAHAPAEVLETWIQYTPDVSVDEVEKEMRSIPHGTPHEITRMAATLSDTIIRIHDAIAEATAAEKVREAIADLRATEQRDKIRATRSAEQ